MFLPGSLSGQLELFSSVGVDAGESSSVKVRTFLGRGGGGGGGGAVSFSGGGVGEELWPFSVIFLSFAWSVGELY